MGLIIAIVRDRYYSSEQIRQFAQIILRYCTEHEVIFAADFRNELGIGRKLAIQILEFLTRVVSLDVKRMGIIYETKAFSLNKLSCYRRYNVGCFINPDIF